MREAIAVAERLGERLEVGVVRARYLGEGGDGESFDSQIDVDEVVRVVTRMAKEGPTITVVPVDRKHHDVNELVRLRCVIRTVERRRHARPGVDAWLDSRPYKQDYAEKPGPSENRPSR